MEITLEKNNELIHMRLKDYFNQFMNWLVDINTNKFDNGPLNDIDLKYDDMIKDNYAPFVRELKNFDYNKSIYDSLTTYIFGSVDEFVYDFPYLKELPISTRIGDFIYYYENDERFYDKEKKKFKSEFYDKAFIHEEIELDKRLKGYCYEYLVDEFWTNNGLSYTYNVITPNFFIHLYNDNINWIVDYEPNGSITVLGMENKKVIEFKNFSDAFSKMEEIINNLESTKEVFIFRNGELINSLLIKNRWLGNHDLISSTLEIEDKEFVNMYYQDQYYNVELSKCNGEFCKGYNLHILPIPQHFTSLYETKNDLHTYGDHDTIEVIHYGNLELGKALSKMNEYIKEPLEIGINDEILNDKEHLKLEYWTDKLEKY